jgi:predicted small metal-binding protein
MSKQFACGAVVDNCAYIAEAATEPELIEKVKTHAAKEHGVTQLTPELAAKVKAAIETR